MKELVQVGSLTKADWEREINSRLNKMPKKLSVVKTKLTQNRYQFMISKKPLPKSAAVHPKAYVRQIWNFMFEPSKHKLHYYNGFDHKEFIVRDESWGNIAKAVSDIASFDWIETNDYAQSIFKKDLPHYLEMQALATRCINGKVISQNN